MDFFNAEALYPGLILYGASGDGCAFFRKPMFLNDLRLFSRFSALSSVSPDCPLCTSPLNPLGAHSALTRRSSPVWGSCFERNHLFWIFSMLRPCTQGLFYTAYPETVAPFFVNQAKIWTYGRSPLVCILDLALCHDRFQPCCWPDLHP